MAGDESICLVAERKGAGFRIRVHNRGKTGSGWQTSHSHNPNQNLRPWGNDENWCSPVSFDQWFGLQVFGTRVTHINLSGNRLRGNYSLPTDVCDFCHSFLRCVILGKIPACLSVLTGLQELDLSKNELSGKIPVEFTNLIQCQVGNRDGSVKPL